MNSLEATIACAIKLTETLERVCQLFDEVTGLIDAEHDLIKISDIKGIERITNDKIELGVKVESSCQELTKLFDRLKQSLVDEGVLSSAEVVDLYSLVKAFGQIEVDQESTEGKLITHNQTKLLGTFEEFKEKRARYKPLIEMNQYLIKKLLEHHQETYRFWQSIAAESEATYGDKGQSRGGKSHPVIQVKT